MPIERSTVPGLEHSGNTVKTIPKSQKIEESMLGLMVSIDCLELLHHEITSGEKLSGPATLPEIAQEPLGALLDILPDRIQALTDRINSCVAKMRECLI
jgi:hypothetical protein